MFEPTRLRAPALNLLQWQVGASALGSPTLPLPKGRLAKTKLGEPSRRALRREIQKMSAFSPRKSASL